MKYKDLKKLLESKDYLTEMPWLEWMPQKFIDLEIEQFAHNPVSFLNKLEDIFITKHHEDKYHEMLNLENKNSLKSFVDALRKDSMLMDWMKNTNIYKMFVNLINKYKI